MAGRAVEEEEDGGVPDWAVAPTPSLDEMPYTLEEIMEYQRRRDARGPRGPPPARGRPLLEVKGRAEVQSERVRREALQRLEEAADWTKEHAESALQRVTSVSREALGWLRPAEPYWMGEVDWEKELFLPEEREKIREWRAKGFRPPLDWDGEIRTRAAEYVSDVACKGMRDALQACYDRNYTHLHAKRCGNRMRWYKQCSRYAVQRVMPDWGDLPPAPSLNPHLTDDFAPQNMRWPPRPPAEAYVFPSASLRYELMDSIGDFRMDSLDLNSWPLPFLYQFREELGVPDWMFDWPTAFGPSLGPVDGQQKHRDLWPNLHSETENWPNEYADEFVMADLWLGTDPRAKGDWHGTLDNTCDSRDLYCRSARQVLKYRLNPWSMIIPDERDYYTMRDFGDRVI